MGFLEERDLSDVPSIPEYYRGKNIFITGGSGFMGQTLIEKLLYSCAELNKIYVLLRAKKGVPVEDRLAKLYLSPCFNRLREEKPGLFEEKVVSISGDVGCVGLGLSDEDRKLLTDNTHIIFHAAASVRFDDPLPVAANNNIRSAREVVSLAKEMKQLSAIVHVSTSYANSNHHHVEEKLYPPFAEWRDTLEICEGVDQHVLDSLTNKYKGTIPNTYIFTKQLAEHLVFEQKGLLPFVITRPSIVIASAREPFPGWVNNFNGPSGIIVACGKGIMRSIYANPDLKIDLITVDSCIRHFISAAWIRGTKPLDPSDDVPIYNCCSGDRITVTMGEILERGKVVCEKYPIEGILWNPKYSTTTCKTYHYIKVVLLQVLQALFVDSALILIGKSPMLLKIQRRIFQAGIALEYFTTREWKFDNDNYVRLSEVLKKSDEETFSIIDIEDKDRYFEEGGLGGKICFLNEKLENVPKAKTHLFRLRVLDFAVSSVVYGYIAFYAYNSSYIQTFLNSII